MVFSSLVFLCIFMPIVWILHFVLPNRRVKNGLLLVASLLFYAFGEPVYVLLMLASALFNYAIALAMDRYRGKLLLILAVVVNIGVLCAFKYMGFVLENINAALGLAVPVPAVVMPIGISFFTFQALSYVIDVYRGQVEVQRNYAKVLLYISFFPQLIAGPIVRYRDIAEEIDNRTVSLRDSACGFRRFTVGLGKKVLIANAMGAVADKVFQSGASQINGLMAWLGAIAYLMQIYYDFSGYSDMAIGLGRMFGFHFLENFNHPYMAGTMQEFWRRWHISLSSWFRDYVYIPLGGNRKGRLRTVLNRLIVFFLTGLWHGANWTFIVWGLFHGFFLLLEEALPAIKKLPALVRHLYTLLAVTVGFVIFRADSLREAGLYLGRMFGNFDFSKVYMSSLLEMLTPYFIVMLLAAVICCGPFGSLTKGIGHLAEKKRLTVLENRVQNVTFVMSWLILVWCIIRLSGSSYNPFIYFRF